jgi:hypothetical protein
VFDIFVEVFQKELVARGLISADLAQLSDPGVSEHTEAVQREFDGAYQNGREGFRQALLDARDHLGRTLARAWSRLDPQLSFRDVGRRILEADDAISGGRYAEAIRLCFAWREIDVGC